MKIKITLIILLAILIIISSCKNTDSNSEKDILAKCLTEKEAKFYGASWCGHCKSQKELFGDSMQYIDYVECTEKQQTCTAAGIRAYPTWIINDKVHEGVQSLDKLKELTGC